MAQQIKVKYEKLRTNWGLAHIGKNLIKIDKTTKGKKHLEILTHEALHILLPEAEEQEIVRLSCALTSLLWKEGYRRMDNDVTQPLQEALYKLKKK
jgi:hypothetical protein